MKKFFLIAAVALLSVASCTTVKTSTSTMLDVNTSLRSNTEADLIVSDKKISYTYTPLFRSERKMAQKKVISNAVSAALKANGNADVLVAAEYEIVATKKLWFSTKTRQVIVTGYPAVYKNFRNGK